MLGWQQVADDSHQQRKDNFSFFFIFFNLKNDIVLKESKNVKAKMQKDDLQKNEAEKSMRSKAEKSMRSKTLSSQNLKSPRF